MAILSRETVLAGLHAAARIRSGEPPTKAEIAAAPKMEAWSLEPVEGGLYRLVGMVTGHPVIPPGFCRTSALLVMSEDRTWARTVSRVYALGPALHDFLNETRPQR